MGNSTLVYVYIYIYVCIYVYVYCEWLTEVASSKTVSPENVPMGPTASSKLFCACRRKCQIRNAGLVGNVELATALLSDRPRSNFQAKWRRHSTPTTDALSNLSLG